MLELSPLSFTSPDLLPTVPLGYTTRSDFPGPLVRYYLRRLIAAGLYLLT